MTPPRTLSETGKACAGLIGVLFLSTLSPVQAQDSTDVAAVQSIVTSYHEGFLSLDTGRVQSTIGETIFMFNGRESGNPLDWQAHQYLTGNMIQDWSTMMVEQAGPFRNEFEFVHTSISGNSALVITRETGSNRFRTWEDELVTWMIGREETGWRIVGLFIRDATNPGS